MKESEEVKNGELDIPHVQRSLTELPDVFLMKFMGGEGQNLKVKAHQKRGALISTSSFLWDSPAGLYSAGHELEIDQFLKKSEDQLLINLISD